MNNYQKGTQPKDHYIEVWTLIIGDSTYSLEGKEVDILKDAIKSGNRGMVVYDKLVVNIPFIKEFYFSSRRLKPEYSLPEPEYVEEPELKFMNAEDYKKLDQLKADVKKHSAMFKQMTATDFETRRKLLLKQAEVLEQKL